MLKDNRLRRKDCKENEASLNNLQIQQQFMVNLKLQHFQNDENGFQPKKKKKC